MTIEEFYIKRKSKQLEELKYIIKKYKNKYNKMPNKDILCEYLFSYRNGDNNLTEKQKKLIYNTGNAKRIINNYKKKIVNCNSIEESLE